MQPPPLSNSQVLLEVSVSSLFSTVWRGPRNSREKRKFRDVLGGVPKGTVGIMLGGFGLERHHLDKAAGWVNDEAAAKMKRVGLDCWILKAKGLPKRLQSR